MGKIRLTRKGKANAYFRKSPRRVWKPFSEQIKYQVRASLFFFVVETGGPHMHLESMAVEVAGGSRGLRWAGDWLLAC